MKLLNADAPRGRRAEAESPAAPKTLRLGEHRVAYYPADMALFALGDDTAPERDAHHLVPPEVLRTRIMMIAMYLTRECNLACDYCFVSAEDGYLSQRAPRAPRDLMSERTVCRALDLLRGAKQARISFFGGEPLLAWNRLRWAVERAESITKWSGVKMSFHVTTNATLIDEERADYLAAHGFSLIVSIDGSRAMHDAHRKHPGGAGSFAEVRRALEIIARRPSLAQHVTLRGTFVPGEARIVERLEYLNDVVDRGQAATVSVEPAMGCSTCAGGSAGYRPGELLREYMLAARWAVERARAGRPARWMHLAKSLQRLRGRRAAWNECGAAKGYVSVAPDGTLNACHHEGWTVGHVLTGLNGERQEPWQDNRLTVRPRCARCWVRNVCGGGCRMEGYWAHGRLDAPVQVSCMTSKARTVAAMWTLAELADEPEALDVVMGAAPREQEAQ